MSDHLFLMERVLVRAWPAQMVMAMLLVLVLVLVTALPLPTMTRLSDDEALLRAWHRQCSVVERRLINHPGGDDIWPFLFVLFSFHASSKAITCKK